MAKDYRQGIRVAYLQALGALGGWLFGICGIYILGAIFGIYARFNLFTFVAIPLVLCTLSFANIRFQLLRGLGLKGRYQTFFLTHLHWMWAAYISTTFPGEYNAYCCFYLFLIGIIVVITTSSFWTVLGIGLLNILQLYLIYSSFHIPIGQDELIGFFFAMLMTTTCSVVAHLNQKNVHRLRESEAGRVKSETERLHEAKEAELARQALVNAEAAHRVQAAAEIAHQINNPLNYIQLSLLNMKSKLKEMESSLLHLLGHDESPEHTLVRDYYKSLLRDMKDPLIDAEKGVRQVTEAIAEVRSLSGLDGYEIEDISVQELVRSSIEKLLPLVPYEECSRLSFSQNIPQDWVMRGNRYLSKALFTKWFQCVLEHSTGPLQLTFHFDGATTFLTAAIAGTFNNLEIRQKTFQSSLLSLAHQSPIQFELEMSVSKLSLHHHLLDKPILQDPLSKVA